MADILFFFMNHLINIIELNLINFMLKDSVQRYFLNSNKIAPDLERASEKT